MMKLWKHFALKAKTTYRFNIGLFQKLDAHHPTPKEDTGIPQIVPTFFIGI